MSSATSGAYIYTHTHAWDIQASEKENTKSAVNKMWCARRVRWVYRFNGFLWVFLRYINSIKRKPTTTITPLPISRERKRTRLKRKEICVSFSLSEKMKMFLVVIHCNCECQSIYILYIERRVDLIRALDPFWCVAYYITRITLLYDDTQQRK